MTTPTEDIGTSGSSFPAECGGKPLRPNRQDLAIMGVMILIYLGLSLHNLGSFSLVPQTAWQPLEAGESVTVDLGRPVQLGRLYYYCGINDKKYQDPEFTVAYEKDGEFHDIAFPEKTDCNVWKHCRLDVTASRLKITAESPGGTLNEVAVMEKGGTKPLAVRVIPGNATSDRNSPRNLFDEQETWQAAPSHLSQFYFDEAYHGRTAYEHLQRIEPYENTHPPLGKLLIASGIALFGMNSFGWRIVGALFGVALLPLMYLFGLRLFANRFSAFCSAFLLMVDFLPFTHARLAVIDVYCVFFVLLTYYFACRFYQDCSPGDGWRRIALPLVAAGVCFGLGAACKWVAVYGGVGIAFLVVLKLYRESTRTDLQHWAWRFVLPALFVCLFAFVVVPVCIYFLSYIPFLQVKEADHGILDILRNQRDMFMYHSRLKATHPFSSQWWSWPLDLRPVWLFNNDELPRGRSATIASFGNPAIWWLGIPAVITAMIVAWRKKDQRMVVVFTGFICQYLPWVLVTRLTFIYHFFSVVPFMVLSQVYVIQQAMERWPRARYGVYGYLVLAAALFIVFYPVLSGMEVSTAYITRLQWLKTWIF